MKQQFLHNVLQASRRERERGEKEGEKQTERQSIIKSTHNSAHQKHKVTTTLSLSTVKYRRQSTGNVLLDNNFHFCATSSLKKHLVNL